MSIEDDLSNDPGGTVFDVLAGVRAGMLGLAEGGTGVQPMTHFPDPDTGLIWFISSTETELVQSLGTGQDAEYVVISQDHDTHISLRGRLYRMEDAVKLDALWTPVVSAWFEAGREDPRIALLRFDPEVADVWVSSASALRFGLEIIRANLTPEHKPDFGAKATFRFRTVT